MVVITDNNGTIEYVNPIFEKVTGFSLEDIFGKKANLMRSGAHTDEFFKMLWQTILSGKPWKGELQNKRKNGDLYWVIASITPIKNKIGEITHFISVQEDITLIKGPPPSG